MHVATSVDRSVLPVSLPLLKAMCVIAEDIEDYDALITAYARTLGDKIEEECSICVWPQTRSLSFNRWDLSFNHIGSVRNAKCLQFHGTSPLLSSITYTNLDLERIALPQPLSPLPTHSIDIYGRIYAIIPRDIQLALTDDCWTAIYTVQPYCPTRLIDAYAATLPIMFNDPQGVKASERISGALASLFRGI